MREFQERRRMKKLLHSRYMIAFLALVCLLLAHAVWSVYGKYEKSREIKARATTDLSSLQNRQASLQSSIDSLNTPEGQERELRDKFGVVRPGEHVVVIMDQTPTSTDDGSGGGLWTRILRFFGF